MSALPTGQDVSDTSLLHQHTADVTVYASDKRRVINIVFCCFVFRHVSQVFYLDNIQLGDLSMTHDVFPRIKAFTADKIRAMINADKRPMDSSKNGDFIYGISAVSPHPVQYPD